MEMENYTSNPFDRLINDIKQTLGPSSGLTSDDIDVEHLQQLMEEYQSEESDWAKYAFADMTRGFTRNLVDRGNGKSNLVRTEVSAEYMS